MYKTIISIIDVFMVVTPNSARKHSETTASFLEHTHCTQRLHTDESQTYLFQNTDSVIHSPALSLLLLRPHRLSTMCRMYVDGCGQVALRVMRRSYLMTSIVSSFDASFRFITGTSEEKYMEN